MRLGLVIEHLSTPVHHLRRSAALDEVRRCLLVDTAPLLVLRVPVAYEALPSPVPGLGSHLFITFPLHRSRGKRGVPLEPRL